MRTTSTHLLCLSPLYTTHLFSLAAHGFSTLRSHFLSFTVNNLNYLQNTAPRLHTAHLLDTVLLGGGHDNLVDEVGESVELHAEDAGQGEGCRIHIEVLVGLLHQLSPMPLSQDLRLEVVD